jgi:hypothetical protein
VLFQSTHALLQASAAPRFVAISSGAGSIELIPTIPIDGGPYGSSKAALNWVVRKIHYENEWLGASLSFLPSLLSPFESGRRLCADGADKPCSGVPDMPWDREDGHG